jgi:WD40 repeat protein
MTLFSGKLTLPYLLQQGLQRRLWQGKIIDVKLISERSAIIISSAGAELFDFNTGKQLQIFREENNYHNSEITCIAFSSDSKILASASYDLTIRLWDVETGKQIKLIEGHSSTIFEISFVNCDGILVSISADRTIKFWQIRSNYRIQN